MTSASMENGPRPATSASVSVREKQHDVARVRVREIIRHGIVLREILGKGLKGCMGKTRLTFDWYKEI